MLKRLPALALCIVLALVGCKKSGAPAEGKSGATNQAAPKVLLVGNGNEPQDLDPQVISGSVEHHIVIALFEGLVSPDPDTCEPVPAAASSWDVSPDQLTYTFHIRPEARWSNGDPVTARDFVRSYQRAITPALASEYAYMFFIIDGAQDYHEGRLTDFSRTGISATDDHTLVIRLRQRTPFFIRSLMHYSFLPVHMPTIDKFQAFDRRGTAWTRPENMVCNGPFVLKEWRQNQRIVVARSETYWDRASVKLDGIHFLPIESTETEERMFRTGQLHITLEVPRTKIPVYRRERPDSIRFDSLDGIYFYRLNVKHPPLDNPKVRRALALSIDRETLTRDILGGGETPAYSFVPPHNAGYESQNRITGAIAEARRLLAEAGYPEGRGFPKLELLYNSLSKHRALAEAVQQMWRVNLGVEITLRNEEWKVYLDNQRAGNFDIQRSGWVADYLDPHVFLDVWQTNSGNNNTNWGSAEYDRLLRAALDTTTDAERFAVYQKMEKILVDELPIIPVFFYAQPRLTSPKVKGYYVTPLDNYPWKRVDLEQ